MKTERFAVGKRLVGTMSFAKPAAHMQKSIGLLISATLGACSLANPVRHGPALSHSPDEGQPSFLQQPRPATAACQRHMSGPDPFADSLGISDCDAQAAERAARPAFAIANDRQRPPDIEPE